MGFAALLRKSQNLISKKTTLAIFFKLGQNVFLDNIKHFMK